MTHRVSRRYGTLAMLAALIAAASQGCALLPRSHDYILGITCLVLHESGRPIRGAEVVLELSNVAYHAIEPIRSERKVTPESGGVVFMYISHVASTPYALTVSKGGYVGSQATGVAAAGKEGTHLTIKLIRAVASASER